MKITRIAYYNMLGLVLLLSWWWPHLPLWTTLDDDVFWLFNRTLSIADHPLWTTLVAIFNNRGFDAVSFLILAAIFTWAVRRDPRPQRLQRWIAIGLTMLITAGLVSLLVNKLVTYGHPSPTLTHAGVHLLSQEVPFATKDASGNSFPGDHGLMLMTFAAFMWHFAGRRVGLVSVAAVIVLSAPRIIGGGHWFSDVYMGALAIALLTLPWVLCTACAARLSERLQHGLARLMSRLDH
ncbi:MULTISPECIES: phosphatase PAP2 family protein [Chromohalobacter]|uniref:Lipid-A kinase n=1 Tax=Chromohalobacter israelensis (strain ATCC BAA-138 / DSM 3043 / CIP 106854 / NCIMB 13768 / 1H11) TaxID=290398 RepID=Q1QZQ7_CHRI1|nr:MULTISPECIES: phosphatase PAP2 family protein [Chromohalobacter]ABE58051.1 lipid-A kinase [Chromohalobacter salexigens DSM 3043]MDF9434477.1 phosphatase PAP2 family protein [Chromohalobacter israelensis]NWO56077.1 phosphatase PAP2 family protein [Chromohalobacter salexigens]